MVQGSHLKSWLLYLPCFNPFKVSISNQSYSHLDNLKWFKVPISNQSYSCLDNLKWFKVPISNRGCSYLPCFNPFKFSSQIVTVPISLVSIRSRFPSQIVTVPISLVSIRSRFPSPIVAVPISIVSIRSRFPSQIVTALSPLFQSVQGSHLKSWLLYLHCFNPFKVPISNRDCSISIVSIRSSSHLKSELFPSW